MRHSSVGILLVVLQASNKELRIRECTELYSLSLTARQSPSDIRSLKRWSNCLSILRSWATAIGRNYGWVDRKRSLILTTTAWRMTSRWMIINIYGNEQLFECDHLRLRLLPMECDGVSTMEGDLVATVATFYYLTLNFILQHASINLLHCRGAVAHPENMWGRGLIQKSHATVTSQCRWRHLVNELCSRFARRQGRSLHVWSELSRIAKAHRLSNGRLCNCIIEVTNFIFNVEAICRGLSRRTPWCLLFGSYAKININIVNGKRPSPVADDFGMCDCEKGTQMSTSSIWTPLIDIVVNATFSIGSCAVTPRQICPVYDLNNNEEYISS